MEVAVPAIFGAVCGGGVSFWWCLRPGVLGRGSPKHKRRGPMSLTRLGTERPFGSSEAPGTAAALNPQLSGPALGLLTLEGTSPANLLLSGALPPFLLLVLWGLAQQMTGSQTQRVTRPGRTSAIHSFLSCMPAGIAREGSSAPSLRDLRHGCGPGQVLTASLLELLV